MIMYLIFYTIFRGPPIEMAIHPHCQTSQDALRRSVHYKLASEDFILKSIKRPKLNQVKLMTLCSAEPVFLTPAARHSVTRPVTRGMGQTCTYTCPARCGRGSLPWPQIRFVVSLGDANSLMLGRVETDIGHSVNPNTDDLLFIKYLSDDIVHSLSHRLSLSADIVFTDRCFVIGLRTGSRLLRCQVRCIVMITVRRCLLLPRRSVIHSRPRPDEENPSHNYRDIYINIYHVSMPGCCDGLIKTDYMTDHRRIYRPRPDLLYTGKACYYYL